MNGRTGGIVLAAVALGLMAPGSGSAQVTVEEIRGEVADVAVGGEAFEVRAGDEIAGEGRVVGIGTDSIDLEISPFGEDGREFSLVERIPVEAAAIITVGGE